MRDRTSEFIEKVKRRAVRSRISVPEETEVRLTDLENETTRFMKDFLIKVEEIYNMFSKTDQLIEDVIKIHTTVLEFSQTDERLFVFYDIIKKSFVKIAERISELEKSFDMTTFFGSDTELRILSTQVLTLKKKLTSSVSDYYTIQEDYKEKCRARMKRQAKISGADISNIDFDAAIESKTDFFLQAIFPDYNVAHYYMKEIKKRHEDFLRLEKSIIQLRDLIFDVNIMLTGHIDLINRIDKHGNIVNQHVVEGAAFVKDYARHRRTDRFKYFVCYSCVAIFVVMIVMALLSTFG